MLVLCCGMIRSGSTLQYNLARQLVEASGRGETYGWASEDGGGVPRDEIERVAAADRMYVVKSHDLLGIDRDPLPEGSFALCYSYRDLRDVAGSAKSHWDLESDELIARLREALAAYDRVERMPSCLTQSYEVLTGDPARAAREINEHLRLGLDPDDAARLADEWSIDKVEASGVTREITWVKRAKRGVRSVGLETPVGALYRLLPMSVRSKLQPVHRDDSLLHPGHISRLTKQGVPSRAALTPDELRRTLEIGGDWLAARGYELDDAGPSPAAPADTPAAPGS